MKLIFDTNVLIDGLRLRPKGKALIASLEKSEHELYISSVVGFEIFAGRSSQDIDQRKKIQTFLGFFDVVDVSWKIAKRAGEIYRSGLRQLEFPDYIIAATAMEIGAEVVTLNRKHFEKIPGVRIYDFDNDAADVI